MAIKKQNKVFGRTKILLVDSNEITRTVQYDLLHNLGYQVDIAPSGLMALEMFDNNYDVIIFGNSLPDLSSNQIVKIICEQRASIKPQMIVLNA